MTDTQIEIVSFDVDPTVSKKTEIGAFTTRFKVPVGFMELTFRNVVGGAYTAYLQHKRLPSVNEIVEFSGVSKKIVARAIITPEFTDAMKNRGVDWSAAAGLSGEQMLCLQIVLNPTDKRDLRRKLASAGITYTKYRAWLKQPMFSTYLNKQAEDLLTDHMPDFHVAVTEKALSGDLNALKFAYELTGRHDPNYQKLADLQMVVQQLVEIVTRNVTDPETLNRISNELHLTLTANNIIKGEIGS